MLKKTDLFTESKTIAAKNSVVSVKIVGGTLSPEQTRFNKMVARVETLTHDIAAARALGDAHRPLFISTIPPLELRRSELMREMITFLDQRLQKKAQKGLTEKDWLLMRELVCSLTIHFAQSGDAVMQAIFDAHSDESLDEINREEAAAAHAMLNEFLDGDAPALDPSATAEDVFRAGAERLRDQDAAHRDKRSARDAKRGQAARELKGAQGKDDPETVLRTLYRQLASKLHPDRARDPVAREQKNALMSQANAAYEKRDLITLLMLQFAVEQLDSEAIVGMAKEKLAALTHLLKEQVHALEYELDQTRHQLAEEFVVSPFDAVNRLSLARSLKEQRADLQAEISQMEYDFNRVSNNDTELKRWLREQKKLMKQARQMQGMFGML